jgi:hypothetical protein
MNAQTTNSLRNKAEELIAMAADCGIEAKITWESGLAIYISYTNSVYSIIGHTETGKVSVKSYEKWGRRTDSVSMKHLPDYLAFHAGRMTKVA